MKTSVLVAKCRTFLDEIGIVCREGFSEHPNDVDGVGIIGGIILLDTPRIRQPLDILIQAGRLAILDPEQRANFSHNGEEVPYDQDKSGPAAVLWGWLAAKNIGLTVSTPEEAQSFGGRSRFFLQQFKSGQYPGLPFLTWLGITRHTPCSVCPVIDAWLRQCDTLKIKNFTTGDTGVIL